MPIKGRSVLFVLTRGDSIGGAQIHVRDLAVGVRARGWRVAVAVGTPGVFLDLLRDAGIESLLVPGLARSIDLWTDLKAIWGFRRLLRRRRPSLVSCHTAKAGFVGRVAALLSGVPAQYTVHGWQFAEGISAFQRAAVLLVEKFLGRLTRAIITVSDFDRRLAFRHGIGGPRRIVSVHNGMPLLPAPDAFAGGASIRIVMVARFQPQKDHQTLFLALELLDDLPWKLLLVGDGPELDRWKLWVNAKGWAARVEFRGLVLDVASLLPTAEVFVLASRWEGFPMSILEAMRAGLPVVATRVGGVAEAVTEGKTGLLVPAGDVPALAQALGRLMADRTLRQQLGRLGRQRFEAEFTVDRMVEQTERVWMGM
jgi:glycosyltransferase involved in cell wall biosynthesis